MNKKLTLVSIFFIIITILAVVVLINNKKESLNQAVDIKGPDQNDILKKDEIILFYGDGCPHCALVENYIRDNKLETKIVFEQKEVYYNKQNASELGEKAKACHLSTDSIGVPFLWDGSRCIIGDQPIINFFKLKLNQK